jgi:hypothetical protein
LRLPSKPACLPFPLDISQSETWSGTYLRFIGGQESCSRTFGLRHTLLSSGEIWSLGYLRFNDIFELVKVPSAPSSGRSAETILVFNVSLIVDFVKFDKIRSFWAFLRLWQHVQLF